MKQLDWTITENSEYGHRVGTLNGHRIDWWPESRQGTFRYRGKSYRKQNIDKFIENVSLGNIEFDDEFSDEFMPEAEELEVQDQSHWAWLKIDGSIRVYIVHENMERHEAADQVVEILRNAATDYKKAKRG